MGKIRKWEVKSRSYNKLGTEGIIDGILDRIPRMAKNQYHQDWKKYLYSMFYFISIGKIYKIK